MVQDPDSSQGREELAIKEMLVLQEFTSIQVTKDLLQREGLESSSLNASVIEMGMGLLKAKRANETLTGSVGNMAVERTKPKPALRQKQFHATPASHRNTMLLAYFETLSLIL
jgi:hypothetical protein